MAAKYLQEYSPFLAIRGMQIKTKFHLTLVRMAEVNETTSNKYWPFVVVERLWRKMDPHSLSWEGKYVHPLSKSVWRIIKTLKINIPHDQAILLFSIFPKGSTIEL